MKFKPSKIFVALATVGVLAVTILTQTLLAGIAILLVMYLIEVIYMSVQGNEDNNTDS